MTRPDSVTSADYSGVFKACDIRGEFGVGLDIDLADRLGRALAAPGVRPSVLVCGDGRLSTPVLKSTLVASLCRAGAHVLDGGVAPTPAFHHARRKLGVDLGVMVTASHNPAADNGFKVAVGALPPTVADMLRLRGAVEADPARPAEAPGTVGVIEVLGSYCADVLVRAATLTGLRVALDCSSGVLGPIAAGVWRALGAEVIAVNEMVDGAFPAHPPNPAVAANLTQLQDLVLGVGADLGAAYDGDGDRVAFVDGRGRVVASDAAIVLMARAALRESPGAAVIYDQKCSDVVREEIARAGGSPVMERSGYAFIKSSLLAHRAAYAGELSGHHFFLDVEGDDALLASLRFAAEVYGSGAGLDRIVDEIPHYPGTPDLRVPCDEGMAERVLEGLRTGLRSCAALSELDGVRARFEDGWGMARRSVTEPVLTLRFEGRTEEALERVREEFRTAAPDLVGRI